MVTAKLLVICPYNLMHCARWVLSCLPLLFMMERRNYLYLSTVLGTANEQDHCLFLWSVRSLYPTRSSSGFFISTTYKQKKVLPSQHLLPGIAEKLITSYLYRGLECKDPTKMCISPRNRQKCYHGNTFLPGVTKKKKKNRPRPAAYWRAACCGCPTEILFCAMLYKNKCKTRNRTPVDSGCDI